MNELAVALATVGNDQKKGGEVMTRTVWKFPLAIVDQQTIDMPQGARVLSAQLQHDRLTTWALLDDAVQKLAPVHFRIAGTGHPLADLDYATWRFLGTVQADRLVFHVFVQDGLV